MVAAPEDANISFKKTDPGIKREYEYYIAAKTNAYLPWANTICIVVEIFFMFTDYFIRNEPKRIFARILPVVLAFTVLLFWLRKIDPLKLLLLRKFWDISLFITAYWISILSYRTPSFIPSLGSIPFLAFGITLSTCYNTRYLSLLFSVSFFSFVVILIAKFGLNKDLLDLNAGILMMIICLVLNQWRNKLYFSEFILKRRLEATIEQLATTQARLVYTEKMAALGELTSGIAHEIQNPLNFVINFSDASAGVVSELEVELYKPIRDTAYENSLYTDLKDNLQRIVLHGKRISAIIKGMLEHSRANIYPSDPVSIRLNDFAHENLLLAFNNAKLKYKSLYADIVTRYDTILTPIELVPHEMSRVFLNIFDNAFYAVWEKQNHQTQAYLPTVSISTFKSNNYVEVRITDNGIGIPTSVRQKVFQPFFTTKTPGQGTGLGLSISYEIVTKGHCGTLDIKTEEGIGTEFIIRLPIKFGDKAAISQ